MLNRIYAEGTTFIEKLKKLLGKVLSRIESILYSILGLAGIGSPIKEFKVSNAMSFIRSSLQMI